MNTSRHPRRDPRRATRAGLTVILATCTLVACGDDPNGASSAPKAGAKIGTSFEALIDRQLAKKDLTPEVRAIFVRSKASGTISASDYELAFSNYARCVKNAGVKEEYKKLPSGTYQVIPHYSPVSEAAAKADFDKSSACGIKHVAAVEALYTLQVGNHDLLADSHEVATRCLVKAGLVKADFTSATFKELADNGFQNAPFDTTSPAFKQCLANAGMATNVKS